MLLDYDILLVSNNVVVCFYVLISVRNYDVFLLLFHVGDLDFQWQEGKIYPTVFLFSNDV